MPDFSVVPGRVVRDILWRRGAAIIDAVADTYLAHHRGDTVNPDSYFLRFPRRERDRIIALPAAILDEAPVVGIKWISSFPDNIRQGFPRASSVLILNDAETGYPIACLEAAQISAMRTAASAVLAYRHMRPGGGTPRRIGLVGAGIIGRNVMEMLRFDAAEVGGVVIHDLDPASAEALSSFVSGTLRMDSRVARSLEDALDAEVVVLTTTSPSPYILDAGLLRPGQIVLNISLRDLGVEPILASWNILDDVEHCLKAQTSPHLAVQATGNRDFISGTLADLMLGRIAPDRAKPLVFSPFGLGVLDLALGRLVLEEASATEGAIGIPDFFAEVRRWETAR